jgi:hypothetical protein
MLGAGHVLVRRAIELVTPAPVRFEAPLRMRTGRLPRGSDLVHPPTLRKLLAWANPVLAPDLALVLVDADGDGQRRTHLDATTSGLLARIVIAVAKQEFEAWLLADHATVIQILGLDRDQPPNPESLAPGEAKASLNECIGESNVSANEARHRLAGRCDLDAIARACHAFELLLSDLRRLVAPGA